jgi:GINS complex subunit 1
LREYGDILTGYMKAVGLDLTSDLQPPKHLYVMVRVKQNLGEVALASGSFVKFLPGTTMLLRRSDVEQLVRRGALEEMEMEV